MNQIQIVTSFLADVDDKQVILCYRCAEMTLRKAEKDPSARDGVAVQKAVARALDILLWWLSLARRGARERYARGIYMVCRIDSGHG